MKNLYNSRIVRLFVALGLAAAGDARAGSINNGLVVHLSFDGNLLDNSGLTNNGTAHGAAGFSAGKIGSALSYTTLATGTSFNYVSLPPTLHFGATTNFTVAFWVNFTNNTEDLPFIANKNWNSGGNIGWAIAMQDNGTWQWSFAGGDQTSNPVPYQDPTFLRDGNWHHIAVSFNRQANASAYVDGVLVNQTSIAGSTGTIDTPYPVNIGQDGTGSYTGFGGAQAINAHLDDLGIWTRELSATEVGRIYFEALSGVDLSTIPDPTSPYIFSASPANGSTNSSPGGAFSASIQDASTNSINTNSIALALDGTPVVPSVLDVNGTTTLQYQPAAILAPLSTHSYVLVYSDNNTPPDSSTNTFVFTVANYTNIILPAPLYLETFDEVSLGSLPTGWSVQNHSYSINSGLNLNDPTSDSYLNWVVISRQTVENIEAAGIWGSNNRLEVAPLQVVNGILITNLIETNFIYAESDMRPGAAIQYLFSPDFNLTGQSNVVISYHSIYEQNGNNIGAVEYSVDQGASWLPVVYLLDGTPADQQIFYLANGTTIDAVTTMTTNHVDLPTYQDPSTGNTLGTNYGAYIAAPITQALAPFISPRMNGDQISSKRVEVFSIPGANFQPTVRFRFAQAGYGSWYFGIDDFGIYSVAAAQQAGTLTITSVKVGNNSVSLSWSGGTPPFVVQSNTRLGTTNWVNGTTTSASNAVVAVGGAQMFFRVSGKAN